jgi:hypothetical protein
MERRASKPSLRTAALIAATAAAAAVAVGLSLAFEGRPILDHPARASSFLAFALVLQLFSIRVPGRGSVGVSAVALIAAGMSLGAGASVSIAVIAAFAQFVRTRGVLHRAVFDAANFALSSAGAALIYRVIADAGGERPAVRLAGAVAAGAVYSGVNHALLCTVMAVSERRSPFTVWQERFRWARFHFLAFGPLALAAALFAVDVGIPVLLAFAVPSGLVALSLRLQLHHRQRRSSPNPA